MALAICSECRRFREVEVKRGRRLRNLRCKFCKGQLRRPTPTEYKDFFSRPHRG